MPKYWQDAQVVNICLINPHNVGDIYSAPVRYIPWLQNAAAQLPIRALQRADVAESLGDKVVVIGGSGLLGRYNLELGIKTLLSARNRPKALILWGAGNNVHDEVRITQPEYLDQFDLAGVRDWDSCDSRWVPCVSAMEPALASKAEPEHEFVVFDHKNVPLTQLNGLPRMSNRTDDIQAVIKHLASGETVLTNSYHGAYWATLMGRKVAVIAPFSTRFHGLRWAPSMANEEGDWREAARKARAYPEALEQARAANLQFSDDALHLAQSVLPEVDLSAPISQSVQQQIYSRSSSTVGL